MKRTFAIMAIVAVFSLAGPGGAFAEAGAENDPITTDRVRIAAFQFFPNVFTVSPGTTVTVRNMDWGMLGEPHTLTAVDRSFGTGLVRSEPRTFDAPVEPGRYQFLCFIHPPMRGFLIVTAD